MLALLLISALSPTHSTAALRICRPALERKAGGEIDQITVETTSRWRGTTRLRGRMTVFVGMGTPALGSASAHHLIRAEYRYSCWVRKERVWKATIEQ